MSRRRALVLGGTGYVGQEVLRGLARQAIPTAFQFFRSHEAAQALAAELGQHAIAADLAEPEAMAALFERASQAVSTPDLVIHCAALAPAQRLGDITPRDWDRIHAVNVKSALMACQELARRLAQGQEADVVLMASLAAIRPVASPAHFAASQGALVGLTRSLAKELGPRGIRVNLVVAGVLDGGISRDLDPRLRADFEHFSALRRVGTAAEVARAVVRVGTGNRYMTGSVIAVSGGV